MISRAEKALLDRMDRQALMELIRSLVRLDSVIRPQAGHTKRRGTESIRSWIEDNPGPTCRLDSVAPGWENCVTTIDSGRPGPCLLPSGHTEEGVNPNPRPASIILTMEAYEAGVVRRLGEDAVTSRPSSMSGPQLLRPSLPSAPYPGRSRNGSGGTCRGYWSTRPRAIPISTPTSLSSMAGRPPLWGGVPGATAGTFLAAWKRIPALV